MRTPTDEEILDVLRDAGEPLDEDEIYIRVILAQLERDGYVRGLYDADGQLRYRTTRKAKTNGPF